MAFKFDFKKWSEKLRSWLGELRGLRPKGITPIPLPGKSISFRMGAIKLPVIDWEKIYRKSFLYNSIATVICAYFAADLAITALSPFFPLPEPPRPRPVAADGRRDIRRFDMIYARNLFNKDGLIPDADEGAGYDGPPVRTSLPLTLLGVIVIQDGSKSVASVEDKSANQVVAVRPGETIGRDVLVQKIEPDRMIFLNQSNQRREYVELPKDQLTFTRKAAPSRPQSGDGGIRSSGGNRYEIDRKEVDQVLANMNEVLTQARCVPNIEGGRPDGYKCFQIEPGSIYDKLGMRDNDVICGINGQPVGDPAAAFNMLAKLKDPSTRSIELCIKRNGQVLNMQYDIQ